MKKMDMMRVEALAVVARYLGVEKMLEQLKEGEDRQLWHQLIELDVNTNRCEQQEGFRIWRLRKEYLSIFREWKLIHEIKDALHKRIFKEPKLVPMPGTEGNWGEKQWGKEE